MIQLSIKLYKYPAGLYHAAYLTDTYQLYMFGHSFMSQIPQISSANIDVKQAKQIIFNEKDDDEVVIQIYCHDCYTLLLTNKYHVYYCGTNQSLAFIQVNQFQQLNNAENLKISSIHGTTDMISYFIPTCINTIIPSSYISTWWYYVNRFMDKVYVVKIVPYMFYFLLSSVSIHYSSS